MTLRMMRRTIGGLLLLLMSTGAMAQEPPYYFYHGYDYGSEATFNPLSIIINGGYGIFQLGQRDRRLAGVDYRAGWRNVWNNVAHPLAAIREYGWKAFIRTEIVPTTLAPRSSQYFPNYQNHLIGGGMTYRAFVEWFRWHDVPYPKLWALMSLTAYHTLNEVVENNRYQGVNVDPIADMLVFNPLGVLLFSSDRVARFFSETLNLRDWSFFPTIDPSLGTLENNGQNFVIKIRLGHSTPWHLFYQFGLNGILGLSYKRADGRSLSFGAGLLARNLRRVQRDDGVRHLTVDLVWNAGVFYDRNGSLMASVLFSGGRSYRFRATVYPGLLRIAGMRPAAFVAVGERGDVVWGLSLPSLPIGLATRW